MLKSSVNAIKLDFLDFEVLGNNSDYGRDPKISFNIYTAIENSETKEVIYKHTFDKHTFAKIIHSNKTGVSIEWKKNKAIEILEKYKNKDKEFIANIDFYGSITINDKNKFIKEIEIELNNK